MKNEDVRITIILKNSSNNLLANATISIETTYFGFVTIKGFQIWRSRVFNERLQEAINVKPPTIMPYGRPYQFVFFEDKQKWFELESKIYDSFVKIRDISKNDDSENINLDEISRAIE